MLIYNSNEYKYPKRFIKPVIQTSVSKRAASKSKHLTPTNKTFLKSLGFKLNSKNKLK